MTNQTESYSSENSELHGDSIVAIVVAGCSLLATLGTFVYFKLVSKFKDMQQSEIELMTEQNGETNKTIIKVKFVNDEQFEVSSKSAKNGNDKESDSPTKKVFNTLTSIFPDKQPSPNKIDSSNEMTEVIVTNFHDAIDNNNAGDKIIAVTRKGLILNAFNTFLKTVKVYNVDKEQVIDISENHSRSNSAHFVHYNNDSEPEDVLIDHHSSKKVYIPHPTPKMIHRRSFPETKHDDKESVALELSLEGQIAPKNCALDIKDKAPNNSRDDSTIPENISSSSDDVEEGQKVEKHDDVSNCQASLQTITTRKQNLAGIFMDDIYPEKFKPTASKKRPSLEPLIESDNEKADTNFIKEVDMLGVISEY